MGRPVTGRWAGVRLWLVVLAATLLAVAAVGPLGEAPAPTVVADCFQRGYQPPPCSAGGQNSAGATPQTPGPAVPDSGIHSCQNQAAMATAIGLLPAVCPGTGH